jgi:hypothetical protein
MTDQEASDRIAIAALLARYNTEGDRGRIGTLALTFAPDGCLRFSGEDCRGRAAIIARLSTPGGKNPALTVTRHHLGTSSITLHGDHAEGRTYFQVLTNIGLDHHGVYVDALIRAEFGWVFALREVRIDWQSPDSLYPPLYVRGVPPAAR